MTSLASPSRGSQLRHRSDSPLLALGGGAAYAANEWTGRNIKDETLTGADIRGKAATSLDTAGPGLAKQRITFEERRVRA